MTDDENPIATTGNEASPMKEEDAVEEKAINQDRVYIKNIPTFAGFKQFKKSFREFREELKRSLADMKKIADAMETAPKKAVQ